MKLLPVSDGIMRMAKVIFTSRGLDKTRSSEYPWPALFMFSVTDRNGGQLKCLEEHLGMYGFSVLRNDAGFNPSLASGAIFQCG